MSPPPPILPHLQIPTYGSNSCLNQRLNYHQSNNACLYIWQNYYFLFLRIAISPFHKSLQKWSQTIIGCTIRQKVGWHRIINDGPKFLNHIRELITEKPRDSAIRTSEHHQSARKEQFHEKNSSPFQVLGPFTERHKPK